MSQIRFVGTPSDRVHRGTSRTAQKKARWGYVPKRKEPIGWIEVRMYLEVIAVTLAWVIAMFFVWLYAG